MRFTRQEGPELWQVCFAWLPVKIGHLVVWLEPYCRRRTWYWHPLIESWSYVEDRELIENVP